jgi:hypothetical protein
MRHILSLFKKSWISIVRLFSWDRRRKADLTMQEKQFMTDEEAQALFLQVAQEGPGEANNFFNRFLGAFEEIEQRNFSGALSQGKSFLMRNCLSVDPNAYETIHKGAAFYWLGTFAFRANDYESATFFYDAAVSEDLKAGADPTNNPTPALRFIQIEDDPNFLAHPLIKVVQAKVEEVISNYNGRPGRPSGIADITLVDIREKFLRLAVSPGREGWRSLATAFISFFIEWHNRNELLDLRTSTGTAEPFFLHLFKGCVLFESLLKGNPSQSPSTHSRTLRCVLNDLHVPLGIPSGINISETDFGTILANLAGVDDSIETAIQFTGKIRNTVGHNLGWVVQIDKHQYHKLFRMVTSSCLHSIACLYR